MFEGSLFNSYDGIYDETYEGNNTAKLGLFPVVSINLSYGELTKEQDKQYVYTPEV